MFDLSSKGSKSCSYLLCGQFFVVILWRWWEKMKIVFEILSPLWTLVEIARWGCKFFCIGLKISVCLRSCLLIGCSILIFGKWKVGRRTQCGEIFFGGTFLILHEIVLIWFSQNYSKYGVLLPKTVLTYCEKKLF